MALSCNADSLSILGRSLNLSVFRFPGGKIEVINIHWTWVWIEVTCKIRQGAFM